MPIQGTLKTFDVPTILQMIYSSQKTGILIVKRNKDERMIMFGIKEGHIYAALEKIKGKQRSIIEYLYEYGYLTDEHIKEINEKAQNLHKKPEEIVFAEEYITDDLFKKSIENKIMELLTTIIKWGQEGEDGTYYFEDDLTMTYSRGKFQIDVDLGYAVFDAARIVDEIKTAEKKFPTDNIILRKEKEWDSPKEFAEDTIAEEFFNLIDGKRTIGEIARTIHIGKYKMLELANVLTDTGYASIVEQIQKAKPEKKKRKKNIAKQLKYYLSIAAITIIILLNIGYSLYLNRYSSFFNSIHIYKNPVPLTLEKLNAQIMLKTYYFSHLEYPDKLSDVSYLKAYERLFDYSRLKNEEGYNLNYRREK